MPLGDRLHRATDVVSVLDHRVALGNVLKGHLVPQGDRIPGFDGDGIVAVHDPAGEFHAGLDVLHDGDADRCLAIDRSGRVVDGDHILFLCARRLKRRGALTGDAIVATIDNPDMGLEELMKLVPGPDFPTGGFVYGRDGIDECYETGRGRIVMRARAQIEEKESSGKTQIVVTEIPFQVNKSRLIEQIAQQVRNKRITDISDLRDESDRDGMRIVIELKRDATPDVVLKIGRAHV